MATRSGRMQTISGMAHGRRTSRTRSSTELTRPHHGKNAPKATLTPAPTLAITRAVDTARLVIESALTGGIGAPPTTTPPGDPDTNRARRIDTTPATCNPEICWMDSRQPNRAQPLPVQIGEGLCTTPSLMPLPPSGRGASRIPDPAGPTHPTHPIQDRGETQGRPRNTPDRKAGEPHSGSHAHLCREGGRPPRAPPQLPPPHPTRYPLLPHPRPRLRATAWHLHPARLRVHPPPGGRGVPGQGESRGDSHLLALPTADHRPERPRPRPRR